MQYLLFLHVLQSQFVQVQDAPQLQLPARKQLSSFKLVQTATKYKKKHSQKLTFWAVTGVHCCSVNVFPLQGAQIFLSKWACVAQLAGGGSFIPCWEQDRVQKPRVTHAAQSTITGDCAHATENAGHFHMMTHLQELQKFHFILFISI